jgi:UDP-N-acetylmuramoyl-L-alanyl-D-glutamate--2,6-diaminopimelate ligase
MPRHSVSPLSVDGLIMHADMVAKIHGDKNRVISGITQDSRNVEPGDIFCCVRGESFDGHVFVTDAISRGAVAVLSEKFDESIDPSIAQVVVGDVRAVLGRVASAAFRHPASSLIIVGITGTNGKTTTASILETLLSARGSRVYVIGTLTGTRTTPEAIDLQALLRDFVDEGIEYVVMEVSSHALQQHRVGGILFDLAIFTNLGHDHLDFHGDMENYFAEKSKLFGSEVAKQALINSDDTYGLRLLDAADIPAVNFSLSNVSDIDICLEKISYKWNSVEIKIPVGGSFAVTNSLAAISAASILGLTNDEIVIGCCHIVTVAGRFEVVSGDGDIDVVIDFAHTPEALQGLLISARQITRARLVVVFGCGGDRDQAKRPLMGDIASRLADTVIVTSDNPRNENPEMILAHIVSGAKANSDNIVSIVNRDEAIHSAILKAQNGDMVVIAGKGHEMTQESLGNFVPFSDVAVAKDALRKRSGTPA